MVNRITPLNDRDDDGVDELRRPISSYRQYLPPFLWSKESDPEQFLLRFLCIFEAILTGRDDIAAPLRTLQNGEYREYPPYEKIIDQLPDLFDPWRVPPRFLPFLAGSLGLTLDPKWDEYQQRRMIEGASALFQQRWLKRGLYAFLDIYPAAQVRPRIAIDDGEAILRGSLLPDGSLPLLPVAFARPGDDSSAHVGAALSHPIAGVMAGAGPTRSYIVADAGPQDMSPPRGSLWSVALNGELRWTPAPETAGGPTLTSLNTGEPDPPLQRPIAIAIENDGVYLVLEGASGQPNAALIYRYHTGAALVRETVVLPSVLRAVVPVDMVRDPGSGRLLILDQGDISRGGTTPPRILSVAVPATGATPVTVFALGAKAICPTALVLGTSPGTVLIADAGRQDIPADQPVPYADDLQAQLTGDVLVMSLTAGATASSMLKSVTGGKTNLVNPVALSLLSDGGLLILDDGLKSRLVVIEHTRSIPHTGVLVRPARVLRVDVAAPRTPLEIPLRAPLVQPSHIMVDGTDVVVLEKGSFLTRGGGNRDWRCMAHSFGVTVDFSRADFGNSSFDDILTIQRQVFKGLADVLESERPAHTSWSFQFPFDPV